VRRYRSKEIQERKELCFGPHNFIWLVNLNLKNENEKQEREAVGVLYIGIR
jgi:primosomal protein N'